MFEVSIMPGSEKFIVNGKTEFRKNPALPSVEMTKYTFRDGMGTKFEINSKENGYRTLEGEIVDVSLEISNDEFNKGRPKLKLVGVSKSQSLL